MNKKRWALLILCILLLAGYWKLFYKTYSETAVAKNADYIIALDVKRAANTIIWNVITTPALWKKISFSSTKTDRVSWEDMVKLPDYVFAFHISNQPMNAWYTVLEVNDKEAFSKGLLQYHFEKGAGNQYFSKELGIEFIQNGDKLLVGNFAVADKNLLLQTGEDLFVKKQFVSKEMLQKNINAKSHLAIQIAKNNFLQEDAIIKANFDKNKIVVDAAFTPQGQYSFAENNFTYSSNSLFASGFTQPSAPVYALLSDSVKTTISKAVNFDIDSLLHQNNSHYNLDIAAIQPRVDSAISYTYDDNFNPIEKVVVNNVLEPLLNFSVKGDGVSNVYTYWNNKGKLEKTAAGDLFVPLPFVKAYCHKKSDKELTITANNYQPSATNSSTNCIFFLNMQLTKIPAALLKYLPDELLKSIANVESVEMNVKKDKQQIVVHASFNKKKNDLPLVDF